MSIKEKFECSVVGLLYGATFSFTGTMLLVLKACHPEMIKTCIIFTLVSLNLFVYSLYFYIKYIKIRNQTQ